LLSTVAREGPVFPWISSHGRQSPEANGMLDFSWLGDAYWTLISGAGMTLLLILIVAVLGSVLSVAGAAARRSHSKLLQHTMAAYVEIIRNTPFLVQLFFIFFGLPSLGVRLGNVTAAIIAMTMNMTAYGIEVVRAGLDAVPKGQSEGASALGLGRYRIFVSVVLPQALRVIFPALTSQITIILLESAVVSQIAVEDLTYQADMLQAANFRSFETYLIVTLIYLLLAMALRHAMIAAATRWLFRGA
jgi:polar amino acid transport system permease protein